MAGWLGAWVPFPRGQRTAASLWKGRPSHCGGDGVGACEGGRLKGRPDPDTWPVRARRACGAVGVGDGRRIDGLSSAAGGRRGSCGASAVVLLVYSSPPLGALKSPKVQNSRFMHASRKKNIFSINKLAHTKK